jgi:hypothetical protein
MSFDYAPSELKRVGGHLPPVGTGGYSNIALSEQSGKQVRSSSMKLENDIFITSN